MGLGFLTKSEILACVVLKKSHLQTAPYNMKTIFISHCCAVIFAAIVCEQRNENLYVETNSGPVRGKTVTSFTQKPIRAFYGIPYAEPPVGKLRFKPPVPVSPWTDVLDATRTPLPCYQQYTRELLSLHRKIGGVIRRPWSEDCLTLNIWTPAVVPHDAPVVIAIHAGKFMTGSGVVPYSDASTGSGEMDSIFITFNYRLGAFGFLSLGIPEISGNMGLMDQHLALKWVRENVENFGGKREAIFFLGMGAGAASIGFQVILPENDGLFRTGIIVGGSPICPGAWHSKQAAAELGKSLLNSLDCGSSNITDIMECLQNVHPENIIDYYFFDEALHGEYFKPNIDGVFIREEPLKSMEEGRFNNNTLIVVNGGRSGSLRFLALNEDMLTEAEPGLNETGFVTAIKRSGLAESDTELELIKDWYAGNKCPLSETEFREAAVEVYSDGLSVCCSEEFLRYATQHGVLTYRIIMDIPDAEHPPWIGSHDLIPLRLLLAHTLDPRRNYSQEIIQMTVGSMITGKIYLRKKAKEFSELVPVYNVENKPYLLWKGTPSYSSNFRKEECVLWNEVLPMLREGRKRCENENVV